MIRFVTELGFSDIEMLHSSLSMSFKLDITRISSIRKGPSITCHELPFAFAMFLCEARDELTKILEVDLEGSNGHENAILQCSNGRRCEWEGKESMVWVGKSKREKEEDTMQWMNQKFTISINNYGNKNPATWSNGGTPACGLTRSGFRSPSATRAEGFIPPSLLQGLGVLPSNLSWLGVSLPSSAIVGQVLLKSNYHNNGDASSNGSSDASSNDSSPSKTKGGLEHSLTFSWGGDTRT